MKGRKSHNCIVAELPGRSKMYSLLPFTEPHFKTHELNLVLVAYSTLLLLCFHRLVLAYHSLCWRRSRTVTAYRVWHLAASSESSTPAAACSNKPTTSPGGQTFVCKDSGKGG